MNKFEVVSKYITDKGETTVRLPVRATAHSAGYDFYVAEQIVIPSYRKLSKMMKGYVAPEIPYPMDDMKRITKGLGLRPSLVPTGVKCQLDDDKYLEISMRSSTPLNSWLILANGIGIIDSDYYNNPDNEGEIFFQVINLSPVDIVLNPGDKIGQGIIKTYSVVEDDAATGERTGGFGSTGGGSGQNNLSK